MNTLNRLNIRRFAGHAASAKRAAEFAQLRYRSGYVFYFDVVDAQRTELGNERASAQLSSERLNTEVALIRALGGA